MLLMKQSIKKLRKTTSSIEKLILRLVYKYKKQYFYYESYNLFKNYPATPKIIGYQLNKNTALGKKGDIIYLPPDLENSWGIINSGEISYPYKDLITQYTQSNQDYIFIDIGANVGLVTKELINKNLNIDSFICVEPIEHIYSCLKLNIKEHSNVFTYNFGLGNKDSEQDMYTDPSNHGNSSLLKSMMVKNKYHSYDTSKVSIKSVEYFFELIKDKIENKRLIIKIDVQGYDELILSLIPNSIIEMTDLLIYELSLDKEYYNPDFNLELYKDKVQKFTGFKSKNNIIKSYDDLIKITSTRNNGRRFESDIYLYK